jgi:hypothetical protein
MMSKGKEAWNELYDLMAGSELTADTYLIKLELVNHLKKLLPDQTDLQLGILLMIIADSTMRELVDKNG